jgi:hypothetical protein
MGVAYAAYAGRYADAEYTLGDAYVTRCNTELVSTRAPTHSPPPPPGPSPNPEIAGLAASREQSSAECTPCEYPV